MIFALLHHHENIGTRWGVESPAEVHVKPYEDRGGQLHLMVTCGTAEDHVSRAFTAPPIAQATDGGYRMWIEHSVDGVVREWQAPIRRLRENASAELAAAVAAGAVCWPE